MTNETAALVELAELRTQRFTDLHERLQAEIEIEDQLGRDACSDAKRKLEEYGILALALMARGGTAQSVRDELVTGMGLPESVAQAVITREEQRR